MAGAPAMRGVSRESLDNGRARLDQALGSDDVESLGDDLFGIARAIHSSVNLRRALTDPNASAEDKGGLVERLLAGKVSSNALEVTRVLAGGRWAAGRDLTDAVESLGVVAVVDGAERDGSLDAVEDELFRFDRIVEANPALQQALTDESRSTSDRGALVDDLLGQRANPRTVLLVKQAVTNPRGRRLDQVFEEFEDAIAQHRQRSVAIVTSAVPLSEEQTARLQASLTRLVGREIHLNFAIDPSVIGGLRVQVGDEVIDGSVSSRLHEAKRRLAG